MIVRILGEGQFELPDATVPALNELDAQLEAAVSKGDPAAFSAGLGALLELVRSAGAPLAADSLVESDAILPAQDASLDDVRDMLADDGLIPG